VTEGSRLTVEDVAGYPHDWSEPVDRATKMRLYARAGIPTYWLIDPLANEITLTEFRLGPQGNYQQHRHSAEQVVIDSPWQVALDLPRMTQERDELYAAAREDD
jgi:Uma2 family endonuclease